MNWNKIIKRLILVIITLSGVVTATYFYIPKYINNKIDEKAKSKGINIKYERLSWSLDHVSIQDADILYKNYEGHLNLINIKHHLGKVISVEVDGGSISVLEDSEKKDDGQKAKSELEIDVKDIDVNLYNKYDGKFHLNHWNSKDQVIDFKDASINIHSFLVNIDRGKFGNGIVELNNLETSSDKDKILDIYKSYRSGTTENPKNTNNKIQEIRITKLTLRADEYLVISKGFKFDGSVTSESITLQVNDTEIVTGNNIKFTKNDDKLSVKADSISTHVDKIDSDNIVIENMEVNIGKKDENVQADFKVGELKGDVDIKLNEGPEVNLRVQETDCNKFISSLPVILRDNLEGLNFSGTFKANVSVNVKKPSAKLELKLGCKPNIIPAKYSKNTVRSEFTRTIYGKNKEESIETSGPKTPGWVSIHSISPHLLNAVITSEDPGFKGHKGISVQALENSLVDDIRLRKFVRGGSTISMQTVKNLWLTRSKTISRKFQEVILTQVLENILTKDEILETYLNIVEFSPGEYGISKACKHYFKSAPSELSVSQAAFLASMLPNPKAHPWDGEGKLSSTRLKLVQAIIGNMRKKDYLTESEFDEAMKEVPVLGNSEPDIVDPETGKTKEVFIDHSW